MILLLYCITITILLSCYLHTVDSIIDKYTPIKQSGYCSQYGICAGSSDEQYQNCINNTQAVISTFDASDICGQKYIQGTPMCCSYEQYIQLKTNLQRIDPILGRCQGM